MCIYFQMSYVPEFHVNKLEELGDRKPAPSQFIPKNPYNYPAVV